MSSALAIAAGNSAILTEAGIELGIVIGYHRLYNLQALAEPLIMHYLSFAQKS